MAFVWGEDDETAFIEAYRERAILYDKADANFKDKDLKQQAWDEIAKKFKVTAAVAKDKWKNLRDGFVRERKKKSVPSGSAASALKEPKWVHYRSTSFVEPHLAARKTKSNMDTADEEPAEEQSAEEQQTQKEGELQNTQDSQERDVLIVDTKSETPPSKRFRRPLKPSSSPQQQLQDSFRRTLDAVQQKLQASPSENQNFTDHIRAQIDQLDPLDQLEVKEQIQAAVNAKLRAKLLRSQPPRYGSAPPANSQLDVFEPYGHQLGSFNGSPASSSSYTTLSSAQYQCPADGSYREHSPVYTAIHEASQFN